MIRGALDPVDIIEVLLEKDLNSKRMISKILLKKEGPQNGWVQPYRNFYGRPGRFRTADLYRVKVALSP